MMPSDLPDLDVIVVGAGLSGIAAGYHLQAEAPGTRYAILEARDAIGGTWDLFRYPGLRSDSDMPTYGYAFEPWTGEHAIASGSEILDYLRTTAARHGVDRHIRFGHRVARAAWSSDDARWTLEVMHAGATERLTCRFLIMCSGYYDTAQGYAPAFAGVERFGGRVVHPQAWREDLEWAGQHVVVVGSGATAVTLAPVLAQTAAHVTMLQRSPTYIVAQPSTDAVADWFRAHLPVRLASRVTRGKNALGRLAFYAVSRRFPARVAHALVGQVRKALGPDADVETHFTPRYAPWDQRICVAPDSDFFDAIRAGTLSVVTDQIETFTETGIRLRSGAELPADLVVTATGLTVRLMGDVALSVDGEPVDLASRMAYRGVLLSGVPNVASVFGYTNTSWTLRAELSCAYVCRLLGYMARHGYASVVPRPDASVEPAPFLDFTAGYVERSRDRLPQQGLRGPWRNRQNYLRDLVALRLVPFRDGVLEFTTSAPARPLRAARVRPTWLRRAWHRAPWRASSGRARSWSPRSRGIR